MKQYLLIDIGGTFIKYSLTDAHAQKVSGGKVPTPLTGMDDLLATIEGFAAPWKGQFEGCAVSMPGRIDTKRGIAHTGGILSGFMWEQPFASLLEQSLGVPVVIANDGKCAAAAEAWTGSLAGVDNGLVLVLGTGIGGGIILNGRVYMGSHSAAGEVSNLVTELGSMEGDDFRFEVIGKVAESPVWAGKASASGLIAAYAAEKQLPAHAPQPTGEEIFAAYAAGEPEACRALKSLPAVWRWASSACKACWTWSGSPLAAASARRMLCCLPSRRSWMTCLHAARCSPCWSRSWCAAATAMMPI